jgi:hypothetical protein
MMNDNSLCERQALAHAEQNLTNTNNDDGMLPAASCSHPSVLMTNILQEYNSRSPNVSKLEVMWSDLVKCVYHQLAEEYESENWYSQFFQVWQNIKTILIPTAQILRLGEDVLEKLYKASAGLYETMRHHRVSETQV